jgi:molybdopterin-containing oxidoreductase family iron-sulfur binding subunit
MVKYGMLIDLRRCTGCRACVQGCKAENNTGKDIFWMYVFKREVGHYPNVNIKTMPRPCQHCDNAPCVKVCPVGARYKSETGAVFTDSERCVGCRYCQVACPYGVNYFNWKHPEANQYFNYQDNEGSDIYGSADIKALAGGAIAPMRNPELDEKAGAENRMVAGGGHNDGVMEKCTFCVQRTDKGLDPACVANCPTFVYTFGDLEDPDSEISKQIAINNTFHLLEHIGTKPSVYYIGSPISRDGIDIGEIQHE